MRTTKPISTISYNSEAYLELKLNELLKSGHLSFWVFIHHEPEDDEAGRKEHCHVYLEPAKMLQTDEIKKMLQEFDPQHPEKPLGCMSFHGSKFDDWYLYGLHDKAYLASKGQTRKFHYKHEDMRTSDVDELLCSARMIDRLECTPYQAILDAQALGITWAEFFKQGRVPIQQIALFERAWTLLRTDATYRNGRNGHDFEVDPDTGEVIVPQIQAEGGEKN